MHTESELRAALRHSASRADALLDQQAVLEEPAERYEPGVIELRPDRFVPARHRGQHHQRLRWTATAVGICAVVAAGAAVVALLSPHGADHSGTLPAGQNPTSGVSQHVPVDLSGVVDTISTNASGAGFTAGIAYGQRGTEDVAIPAGTPPTGPTLWISAVGPAAGLIPARIPRSVTVQIAGITGYYSNLENVPIYNSTNSGGSQGADWEIAFQHGVDWVFVSLTSGSDSINDPTRIVQAYEQAGVTLGKPGIPLAFRTGWLPEGLSPAVITTDATPYVGASVELTGSGGRALSLQIYSVIRNGTPVPSLVPDPYAYPSSGPDGTVCVAGPSPDQFGDSNPNGPTSAPAQPSCTHYTRALGSGNTLDVQETGFDAATMQRILDTITYAKNLNDPATFFNLTDALG